MTETPTQTPTPTATFTSTGTPNRHCHPNPTRGEPVHFDLDGGSYEKIELSIYTTALRKVRHQKHPCNGEIERELTWDLKDDCLKQVANGVYFAVIDTQAQGVPQRHIEKVLILR